MKCIRNKNNIEYDNEDLDDIDCMMNAIMDSYRILDELDSKERKKPARSIKEVSNQNNVKSS